MGIFQHRNPTPPGCFGYSYYRPFIREDFHECCAYCLLHEFAAAGRDNFELDHFCPKSKEQFADLIDEYTNIYYSCHVCNHYKGATWPSAELLDRGFRFIDTCREDFSTHFITDPTGYWKPITTAAQYTEKRLRLNRSHLVEIRAMLDELADLAEVERIDWDRPSKERILQLFRGTAK
jgi:hypothetical protein